MSTIKHKIFLIKLEEKNSVYNLDVIALEEIDSFLLEPNFVYVNHTITALGMDTSPSGRYFQERQLVISLIYKDLTATPNDLKNVSKAKQEIVRVAEEDGKKIAPPSINTKFEKSGNKKL